MPRFVSLLAVVIAACAAPPAEAADAEPDYGRAYALAAASYCAYAVSELDPDRGAVRAARCLAAASASDKALADTLGPTPEVEAFYDPNNPENAYLLVRGKGNVILAFRGTLTPPINPAHNLFKATAEAVSAYNKRANGFRTFAADWINDAKAIPSAEGRHPGFEKAWRGLAARLKKDCRIDATDCSRFKAWVAGLDKTKGEPLLVTGHSKGGALAALATVDLPQNFGVTPVTYTFSGAKAFTAEKAETLNVPPGGFWRFESSNDIVPALAPDKSFGPLALIGFKPYAHIGALALFSKGAKPEIQPGPVDGAYSPNDLSRILTVLTGVLGTPVLEVGKAFSARDPIALFKNFFNSGEAGCRKLVDIHFEPFSNVKALAPGAHKGGPLFAEELNDKNGAILWGYRDWCRLVHVAN